MNKDNILKLKRGSWVRVMTLEDGKTVMLPVVKHLANARVLNAYDNGISMVHWWSNYNLNGDFSTELMQFDRNLVLDEGEKEERNQQRERNGLIAIR